MERQPLEQGENIEEGLPDPQDLADKSRAAIERIRGHLASLHGHLSGSEVEGPADEPAERER